MAYFYIIVAIVIWSSLGIIVRLANTYLTYTIFFPALIALIAQTTILLTTKERKKIPTIKRIPWLLLIGPVFILNSLSFYYAFTHTTIANAVFTHYTAPIFVAMLSPLLLRESIDRLVIVAIIISTTGLLLMFHGFSLSEQHMKGIASGIFSGLMYAILIILGRSLAQRFAPLVITVFQNLVVVLILLPFIKDVPLHIFGYFLLLGLVHSTVAPILFIRGLRDVKASKAAILGYLEPVAAMIFAWIALQEMPRFMSLIGGALIMYSGYLTIKRREKQVRQVS
jgi:drug/metabolite transporter (DMT)-like permease